MKMDNIDITAVIIYFIINGSTPTATKEELDSTLN